MDDSVVEIWIGTQCFQGVSAGMHGYNSFGLVVLTNTFLLSELKSCLSLTFDIPPQHQKHAFKAPCDTTLRLYHETGIFTSFNKGHIMIIN